MIRQALPWTIGLVGIATIISFLIGTADRHGASAGAAAPGWTALLPVTTFFSSVPYFWLGLIAIALFSVTLGWFPVERQLRPRHGARTWSLGVHRLGDLARRRCRR